MKLAIAALLALVAAPAMAQSMNAETFHQRAQALKNKGALAVFSRGEIKALMKEVQAAAKAAREMRLAAEKAGRPPPYCPPGGKGAMDSDEYMRRLSAVPSAERARMTMTEATMRMLAVKHPC